MTDEPGTAVLQRHEDSGNVTVLHADPVIRVTVELLDQIGPPWWDGETLVLDTAALYRYRFLRRDTHDPNRVWVFERITGS
jgi:hypothetical protein